MPNINEFRLYSVKFIKNERKKLILSKIWQYPSFSWFIAVKSKILLPMLVFLSSIIIPCILHSSQPTNNLYAKYYDHPNKWTGAGSNFVGRVIHTRTFTNINTSNYNPAGRGDYWSVVIEGYIYAPQNGTYVFRTLSDGGIRVSIDGSIVVNN